ncbi:hypothetical protein E7Z59_07170 [Robertkochia marina]|uniref:Uncharacterized protein n=1 Tax=Robertkochia marina TaxID=1227945 RepID=A0A4V3UY32_9FLAO|nr:carboxypeptidase-like regulatory domain-containing protein [Robertkochia marina]THD67436.1 hypothetical protein E7Z59_07170 [Robertkochia marina]
MGAYKPPGFLYKQVVVNAKKMNPKIKFTYLILALGLFSCKVLKESNTKILPEFSIQGKSYNELIVNRIPDYGLTGEDGCIVENQIKINLDNINENYISGKISDVDSTEPLINAEIQLIFESDTILTRSNNKGEFEKRFKDELKKIKATYIAYRTVEINLK